MPAAGGSGAMAVLRAGTRDATICKCLPSPGVIASAAVAGVLSEMVPNPAPSRCACQGLTGLSAAVSAGVTCGVPLTAFMSTVAPAIVGTS